MKEKISVSGMCPERKMVVGEVEGMGAWACVKEGWQAVNEKRVRRYRREHIAVRCGWTIDRPLVHNLYRALTASLRVPLTS